jgi:hypothetical protein
MNRKVRPHRIAPENLNEIQIGRSDLVERGLTLRQIDPQFLLGA